MRPPPLAPLLLLLALVRCSGWLPPFETVPLPPSAEQSGQARVAVCYNSLTATADQVHGVAVQSCGSGSAPQPVERDISLNYCPILTPSRATFACAAP
jgi:hypothetical protein